MYPPVLHRDPEPDWRPRSRLPDLDMGREHEWWTWTAHLGPWILIDFLDFVVPPQSSPTIPFPIPSLLRPFVYSQTFVANTYTLLSAIAALLLSILSAFAISARTGLTYTHAYYKPSTFMNPIADAAR